MKRGVTEGRIQGLREKMTRRPTELGLMRPQLKHSPAKMWFQMFEITIFKKSRGTHCQKHFVLSQSKKKSGFEFQWHLFKKNCELFEDRAPICAFFV